VERIMADGKARINSEDYGTGQSGLTGTRSAGAVIVRRRAADDGTALAA
jgi:hypothetical protein